MTARPLLENQDLSLKFHAAPVTYLNIVIVYLVVYFQAQHSLTYPNDLCAQHVFLNLKKSTLNTKSVQNTIKLTSFVIRTTFTS